MTLQLSAEEKRARMARALAKEGFEDVYVLDAASASEVLTPKRRELLDRIVEGNIQSVRSLADEVDRDKGAVSRDLELLARHDLVMFESDGTAKIPKPKHQTVVVEPVQ